MRLNLSPRWALLALIGLAMPRMAAASGIPTYLAVGDSLAFGDTYVNTYTPFLGNEAQDTFITTSGSLYNVHPNAQGYQLIADQMEVPEPSTLIVLGAGLAGLLATRSRFGRS